MADDHSRQTLSPPQFSNILLKISVAQICQSYGFKSAQSSALDSLTRIAALYIQSIASRAVSRAYLCGCRTQCNLFDIIHALEELRLPTGVPGAGDVFRPLLGSAVLKELSLFVDVIREVPFAHRIPSMSRGSVVFAGMSRGSVINGRSEVPRWLPEFPDVSVEEDPKRVSKREVCWEDETFRQIQPVLSTNAEEKKKGDFGLIKGRRERVKFKLGIRNGKILRNGVCTIEKRICLAKRANTFVDEDKDDATLIPNLKPRKD